MRPRLSPCTTVAAHAGTGRRAAGSRASTSPAATSPRMWLEDTISPSTSTSGDDARLERRLRAQQRDVAARPVAEAEVLADADLRGAEPLDQHVVDELLRGLVRRTRRRTGSRPARARRAPAIRSALRSRSSAASAPPPGATTARGCGSKVSTVSAPRITSRWPRCTPSNSPTATCRGRGSDVGEPGDVHRWPSAAEAYDGLEQCRPRAARRARPVRRASRSRTVPRRRRPRHRARRGRPGAPLGLELDARAGSRAPRRAREPLRVGVGDVERRRSPSAAAPGSRRRRGRRPASARRCPTSTRSRTPARSPVAPEQLEAVDLDLALGRARPPRRRAPARRRAGRRP